MKNPDAQAETVCLRGDNCCISLADVSKLLDIISKISHVIKTSPAFKDLAVPLANDIEMTRNAVIKIRNSLEVFIKIAVRISEKDVDESFVYTMSNTLNRLVEVRNRLSRIIDFVEGSSDNIRSIASDAILWIDSILLRFSLIALAFAANVKRWSREAAGAFSSAIASALFATLLSLNSSENIVELLKECTQY
jgi:hypothetical protein